MTLLAAGGLIPPAPDVLAAMRTSFATDTSDADRSAAIAAAFFAPGHEPGPQWVDGWWSQTATAESAATQRTEVEDWWAAGAAPVLIVQGLDDRVAVPENGRELHERLAGRAELVELADAGHALVAEQPDLIITAMANFLDAQPRQ